MQEDWQLAEAQSTTYLSSTYLALGGYVGLQEGWNLKGPRPNLHRGMYNYGGVSKEKNNALAVFSILWGPRQGEIGLQQQWSTDRKLYEYGGSSPSSEV